MPRKSPVEGRAGAVRIQRLSPVAFAAAEAHGKRLDRAGQARAVYPDAPPVSTTGLDLAELYARHVEGRFIAKSGTKALHMVLQFPTGLVDGEDADTMLDHACRFAVETFGDAAIFADRIDRDEKSRHVVDLFLAPRYEKITKRGGKEAVSTTRHLKALAEKYGKAPTLRGQGQALQDAWHAYLRDTMGLAVERGAAKTLPGDDWQSPEQLEAERLAEEVESLKTSVANLCTLSEIKIRKADRAEQRAADADQRAADADQRAADADRRVADADRRVADADQAFETIEERLGPLRASLAFFDEFRARQADRLRPLARHWQAALDVVRSTLMPSRMPSPWEMKCRPLAVALSHPVSAGFAGRQWSADPRENLKDLEAMGHEARSRVHDALANPPYDWPELDHFNHPLFREHIEEPRAGDNGIVWQPESDPEGLFRRHRAFLNALLKPLAILFRTADNTPEPMPPEAEAAASMPEHLRKAVRDSGPSGP